MPGLTYSVIPRARPLCERCTSDTSPHAAHCRQDPPTSRVAPGVGPPPLQPALQKRTGCLRSSRLAARLPYRFPGPASFSLSLSLSLPPSPSSSSSFPLPLSVLPSQPLRVGRLRLGQALREHAAGRVHEGRRLLLHRLPTCVLLLPVRGRHVERLVSQGAGQAARRLPHEHDMYNMPSAHHRHIRHNHASDKARHRRMLYGFTMWPVGVRPRCLVCVHDAW